MNILTDIIHIFSFSEILFFSCPVPVSPFKKMMGAPPVGGRRVLPPIGPAEMREQSPSPYRDSSTEEISQEMANLEDLMKDLSAITASQFNCQP